MAARVQKWGNSLAVRIPRAFAREAGITDKSYVEIRLVGGHLELIPIAKQAYELEDLLADITDENLHGEVDGGPPAGNEAW